MIDFHSYYTLIKSRRHLLRDYYILTNYYKPAKCFEDFSFNDFKKEVLQYVDSMRLEDFSYRFAKSVKEPTLYSS